MSRGFVGHPASAFGRVLQMTNFTCFPCSVIAVLRHFGYTAAWPAVRLALRTDADGTNTLPALRYLRRRGLVARPRSSMRMRDLEEALRDGGVVLCYLDGDHVAPVHGVSRRHVFLADPSLVRCAGRRQLRSTFKARWEGRSGVVVKPREPVECCG